jgi:thymidylate synthase (FAD)
MRLIKPSYKIITPIDGREILKLIEEIGRTCYKSEDNITEDSAEKFVAKLIKSGHHSVIEHKSLSVRFINDRGISHEEVRHRLASFSQESTRYCNYSKDKFSNELTFIIPSWFKSDLVGRFEIIQGTEDPAERNWMSAMLDAEQYYNTLIGYGWSPGQARSVLPNSLKTEIVVTANLREWRTIFQQRCASGAHEQMRELMHPLLAEMKSKIPVVFDDLYPEII